MAGTPATEAVAGVPAAAEGAEDTEAEAGDDGEEEDAELGPEIEERTAASVQPGVRYTADLSDEELLKLWKESPEKVGSLSIGFADAGRLINGETFPPGPYWKVVDPPRTWGTSETVAYVKAALEAVGKRFEGAPMRVNHFSKPEGGWIRPHRSHQSGRDVDFAFFELSPSQIRGRNTIESRFDVARNWALIRALVTLTDVQLILVDRRVQKRLYDHALSLGEDRAWLDSLFKAGKSSIVFHARRHRDHFHVRFFNPRAQELGRRVQPMLEKGKNQFATAVHRVRRGDCLGSIAKRYDASVAAIRRHNGIRGNLIRAGMTLVVPLRGPCITCPLPPEVVVPPRRLPPTTPEVFAKEPVLAAVAPSEQGTGASLVAPADVATAAETAPAGTAIPPASGSAAPVDVTKAAETAPAGTAVPPAEKVVKAEAGSPTGGSGAAAPASATAPSLSMVQ